MGPKAATAGSLHEHVADQIRRAIDNGELGPGDRLPAEGELAARYEVSRHTVRRALADLTAEGLVTSSRGRGRIVRDDRPLVWNASTFESRARHREMSAEVDQWSTCITEQGRRAEQEIEVALVLPPVDVARNLDVPPDRSVVVRRRLRLVDDVPYQIADSYFPEELVRGTPLMEPRDVAAPGGVLAYIGHPQVRYRDEIRVRMPAKAEAERLELLAGTPVAEHTRIGYAADGRALRVMITIAPGDRNVVVYEVDAR